MLWDIIVVGSGPAGVAAAAMAQQLGASVLLLDKKHFPRPKACAGMLCQTSLQHTPFPLQPVIRHTAQQLQWVSGGKNDQRNETNALSHRIELDAFLHQEIVKQGVAFRQVFLRKIRQLTDRVQLLTNDHQLLQGKILIAADGANSTVRRLTSTTTAQAAFALEIDVSAANHAYIPPLVDYDLLPNGYGWVFPKGDFYNIGVGVFIGQTDQLKQRLAQIQTQHFPNSTAIGKIRGASVGCFGPVTQRATQRILFCGDAANLTDPLTGEGISYAFRSGKYAAEAALYDNLAGSQYLKALQPLLITLAQRQQQAQSLFASYSQ